MKRLIYIFALLLLSANLNFANNLLHKFYTYPDTLLTDSARVVTDSLKTKRDSLSTKIDTIKIFEIQNFANISDRIVNKKEYQRTSYRTPADYLSLLPYGYRRYLSISGQPDELMIYGFGNTNVSYAENGIPVNNRFNNTLDLNNFQSEYIDSVEIISPARSFIYSSVNNPMFVNFNTRNSIESKPYTRLRVLQGPDEEGYIDAIFNAYVMNKVNFTFEITNASRDSLVANDSYGAWQGAARLRYLHSESFNVIGNFRVVKTESKLWGGIDKVNADSLKLNIFDLGNTDALVVQPDTYKKNKAFYYDIRAQFSLVPKFTSEIAGYYQSNIDQYRQNERDSAIVNKLAPVKDNNESYTGGVYFRQPMKYKNIELNIISRFETTKHKLTTLGIKKNTSTFSVGGVLSYHINNKSLVNAFSKYLISNEKSYFGFGGEINISLSEKLKFYGGGSFFEKPYNIFEQKLLFDNSKKYSNVFTEVKLGYFSDNFNINGGVIFSKQTNSTLPLFKETDSTSATFIESYSLSDINLFGMNLNFSGKVSKIEYSVSGTYYSKQDKLNVSPQFTVQAGVFFKSKLFENNLDLKAGFQGTFAGKQSGFKYDYLQSRAGYFKINKKNISPVMPEIDPYFNLDLIITGKIQDRAIIYFVIENIVSNDFYTVPYYPVRKNALRFGVSWEFYD